MHLFGLTGGIASGKSAVAARFRERGVPVIDADSLARELVAPGTDGLAAITRAFGTKVVAPNGQLDRAAVAAIVFSSDAARATLNAILHPRISAKTVERAAELAAKGEPLGCYEAALLVENGFADAFRPLVVVAAPFDLQLARAMSRDNASETDVRKRLAAQMPLETKIQSADIVIDNSGPLEMLTEHADQALFDVCAKLGVDVERYARAARP